MDGSDAHWAFGAEIGSKRCVKPHQQLLTTSSMALQTPHSTYTSDPYHQYRSRHPTHRTVASRGPVEAPAAAIPSVGERARRRRARLDDGRAPRAAHHRAQLEEYDTIAPRNVRWLQGDRAQGLREAECSTRKEQVDSGRSERVGSSGSTRAVGGMAG